MGGAGSRGPRVGRCGGPGIRFSDGWRWSAGRRRSAPVGGGRRRSAHTAHGNANQGVRRQLAAVGGRVGGRVGARSAHGSAQVGGVGAGALVLLAPCWPRYTVVLLCAVVSVAVRPVRGGGGSVSPALLLRPHTLLFSIILAFICVPPCQMLCILKKDIKYTTPPTLVRGVCGGRAQREGEKSAVCRGCMDDSTRLASWTLEGFDDVRRFVQETG
jgi:hypothetical protein